MFLLGPQGWLAGSAVSFLMAFYTAPLASSIPLGDRKVRKESGSVTLEVFSSLKDSVILSHAEAQGCSAKLQSALL